MTFKVGIIGIGFVGSAMMRSFQEKNIKLNENLFIYDKYKNGGMGNIKDIYSTDILFLALPTKYDTKSCKYDKVPIYETCKLLIENKYKGAVIIKSTVEPETTNNLSKEYNLSFIHNPEFLTARTAYEDFHNQEHIVLGKGNNCEKKCFNNVVKFYKDLYPKAKISECTALESESMKIYANCYYATKVQFFTEIYLACKTNGSDYNKIVDMMIKNGWINKMHTKVPGPDGKISYGGLCFPKDTNALNKYYEELGVPHNVLASVITERNNMRNDNENIK